MVVSGQVAALSAISQEMHVAVVRVVKHRGYKPLLQRVEAFC